MLTSILFTIPNFITAGSGRAMLNIVERLDRSKFRPIICVSKKGGALDVEVERLGIPLIEAPFTVEARPYFKLLPRAWRAAQVFRPYRFHLWHSFHYSDDYTEPIIARLAGTRQWLYTKKNMSWGSRAWNVRSGLATAIAAQNTHMLRTFFAKNQKKVRYIPCGVDFQRFKRIDGTTLADSLWGFPNGTVVAAHVGHFLPIKNQAHLLRSLEQVSDNICMVFAGGLLNEKYGLQLTALVRELGLEQRVRFLGKVNDIAELLNKVDIFTFCSHSEACPVAVLEAMACGLPSIVTDIPAMHDIHLPDKTAIIVPHESVSSFSSALELLAGQPEMRKQMGQTAQERVNAYFSLKRETAAYEQLYQDIL